VGDSAEFNYQQQQLVTIFSGADALLRLRPFCEQQQGLEQGLEQGLALNVLVVTSKGHHQRGSLQPLLAEFQAHHVMVIDTIQPNPDIDALDTIIADLHAHHVNIVIGFGRGSAMDPGKVLACY